MESSSGNSMVKLTSTNYSLWRPMMEDLLYCKDLYDPIDATTNTDGSVTKPSKPEKIDDKEWAKMKRKTLGTIRQWVDISIFNHVSQESDPYDLWKKLEGLYERKTAHNKVSLIKRLVNLKLKDGKSVSEHLSDFQDVINKLTTMKIVLDNELQALFLLSSLPDSWETLVVTISNSAPNGVFSLDVIKESMFNEEIRRKEMGVGNSHERLREMSMAAIKEYYSAKDVVEAELCIKELNAPNFYPTLISMWVADAFERKDMERNVLAKLLVSLTKSRERIFNQQQLIQGFESVLKIFEETVTDAPKAPEYLGRMFGTLILEDVLPLPDVCRLIHQGGDEPGRLREVGLAADLLGCILEVIKAEKGDATLNEIRTSSNLRLHDYMPPEPLKSRKLEMFL